MENSGWKEQYREAWANYRQEDQNKRTAYTHYLVTAGGIAVILHGTDQPVFAFILCCLGVVTSLICLLYLARTSLLSDYWQDLKDRALSRGADENSNLVDEADFDAFRKKTLRFKWSHLIGIFTQYQLTAAYPILGIPVFILIYLARGA